MSNPLETNGQLANPTPENPPEGAILVKKQAAALGFDACGIASAGAIDPDDGLGAWLGAGYHADMTWLAATQALRQDPRRKLPGARSVVVVARNYYAKRPRAPVGSARVARYAWGRDYHKVLKTPIVRLARFLDELGDGIRSYISVDTGSVLECAWAVRAGVGWRGKNGLVLRRDLGSWFFLGVIITTVELAPDPACPDYCGACRACLDACPTGALVAPGVVDARRCIAYHTVENRGEIPATIQARIRPWLFGCDACQEVCPWNRRVHTTSEAAFHPRPGVADPGLEELLAMERADFDSRFAGTPVRRAKYEGILRNARAVKGGEGTKA